VASTWASQGWGRRRGWPDGPEGQGWAGLGWLAIGPTLQEKEKKTGRFGPG
jgi:hypothetical protein